MESTFPQKSRLTVLRPWVGWIFGILLGGFALFYFGRTLLVNSNEPVTLIVYAFSTQEEVFTQGIFPAFERKWEDKTGQELNIEGVFGPAETLAGQITLGAPADIAIFSNRQQVTWLQVGKALSQKAEVQVIGSTPLVIVTRPSTPFGINNFADLSAANELNLLHPDPNTSGVGEWALLAEYGSAYLETGQVAAAEAQLKSIWQQVCLLAPSARAALTLFELGAGDALITYEQDALLAAARGVPLKIIYPPRTILAQPLAVIVDQNIDRNERAAAQAFMDFLIGAEGQQIISQYYMRPVDNSGADYQNLVEPFTVEDLGGWALAYTQLVEVLWRETVEPGLDLTPASILLDSGD